jgi:hypothetical protein
MVDLELATGLPSEVMIGNECARLWPRIEWVCDALIPADPSGEMPSAFQVFQQRPLLQRALLVRNDLAPEFFAVLDTLPEQAPAASLRHLQNDLAQGSFDLLSQIVAGAYFLEPSVNNALGYPGQGALPLDPDYDEIFELIESVQSRGSRFIEPPD